MKQVILNQVTLCADGSIGVQWLKQFVDPDTGEVLFSEPHRTVVDAEGDVDNQVALASAHLQQMGYPAIPPKHAERIRGIDGIGRSDVDIEARRQDVINERAARRALDAERQEAAARASTPAEEQSAG